MVRNQSLAYQSNSQAPDHIPEDQKQQLLPKYFNQKGGTKPKNEFVDVDFFLTRFFVQKKLSNVNQTVQKNYWQPKISETPPSPPLISLKNFVFEKSFFRHFFSIFFRTS